MANRYYGLFNQHEIKLTIKQAQKTQVLLFFENARLLRTLNQVHAVFAIAAAVFKRRRSWLTIAHNVTSLRARSDIRVNICNIEINIKIHVCTFFLTN